MAHSIGGSPNCWRPIIEYKHWDKALAYPSESYLTGLSYIHHLVREYIRNSQYQHVTSPDILQIVNILISDWEMGDVCGGMSAWF